MGKTRFIIRLSILIILVFAGMVSSCTQEIYPDDENLSGGMTWVYLDFAPEEVDVVLTKEVQTEATENKIFICLSLMKMETNCLESSLTIKVRRVVKITF